MEAHLDALDFAVLKLLAQAPIETPSVLSAILDKLSECGLIELIREQWYATERGYALLWHQGVYVSSSELLN